MDLFTDTVMRGGGANLIFLLSEVLKVLESPWVKVQLCLYIM